MSSDFKKPEIKESPSSGRLLTINDLRSPKGSFFSGHIKDFNLINKHQVVERWVRECGDLFKINFYGKKFIVSADPELNDQMFKNRPKQFRRYSKIDAIMREMGVLGVFNAEGDEWKTHRKITSEALNGKNMSGFFPHILKVTERFLQKWKQFADDQTRIDVHGEMMRYSVDITTLVAFSYDTNTVEQKDDVIQNHLERIFPMINERMTAPFPIWRIYKTKKDKELDVSLAVIENKIREYIDIAKKKRLSLILEDNKPKDFLEALLIEKEKVGDFSDSDVYGNVFSMLMAGEDTTSNTISWIIYYVAMDKELQAKLRQEAKDVFGDNPMATEYDQLSQLKFAEAVSIETLRLKPVAPLMFMEANEDTVVGNVKVNKGMTVLMQNKVPQTREDNFSNSDSFVPERWLKGGCPHHDAHKPKLMKTFGGGPRFCPGKLLAMDEMKMAISMLCKNFEFSLAVNPDEVTEVFAFTMLPDNLWITLKRKAH